MKVYEAKINIRKDYLRVRMRLHITLSREIMAAVSSLQSETAKDDIIILSNSGPDKSYICNILIVKV
jgi:hypothetical protein